MPGKGIHAAGVKPQVIVTTRRKRQTVTGIIREWKAGAGDPDGREAAAAIQALAMDGDFTALKFCLDAIE